AVRRPASRSRGNNTPAADHTANIAETILHSWGRFNVRLREESVWRSRGQWSGWWAISSRVCHRAVAPVPRLLPCVAEEPMEQTTPTRRTLLRSAAATTALAAPFLRSIHAAARVGPSGSLVLAWPTNIAARWLDPQQHDGGATPDNFLNAAHDALIKNFRDQLYDHLALVERYDFAEDAKSATFQLRPGLKFHDGSAVTPEDVKWSYEHYRGAWGEVLHEKTDAVETVDERTVRFHFREPFLDFPIL